MKSFRNLLALRGENRPKILQNCINHQSKRNCSQILPHKGQNDVDPNSKSAPSEANPTNNHDNTNKESFQSGVYIDAYSTLGFRFNWSIKVIGPVIVFPKAVFSWNVKGLDGINADSLCIINVVQPKISTLIIGTGDEQITTDIGKAILEITHKNKINIEVLSTQLACTHFNFLNREGRMIAAALLPPSEIPYSEDDVMATQARDGKLFKLREDILD